MAPAGSDPVLRKTNVAKDSEYRNPNTRRRRFREVTITDEEDDDAYIDGDYGLYELTPDTPGDGRIVRKKVE